MKFSFLIIFILSMVNFNFSPAISAEKVMSTQSKIEDPFQDKFYNRPFKYFNRGNIGLSYYLVGWCYYYGIHAPKNFKKALRYVKLSCKKNYSKGCKGVGVIYEVKP